ncbi:hypothetical protein V8C86DRAFT_2617483 [Haematococcus lacustris]
MEPLQLRALQSGGLVDAAAMSGAAEATSKAEADSRSIYVGNVDYLCTTEELEQHFEACGSMNRVTIPHDKFGSAKGFAYIEFHDVDAVGKAILLGNTELQGRNIKVMQKRTNVPGLKARGRGRGREAGYVGPRGAYARPFAAAYAAAFGRGRRGFVPRGPRGMLAGWSLLVLLVILLVLWFLRQGLPLFFIYYSV